MGLYQKMGYYIVLPMATLVIPGMVGLAGLVVSYTGNNKIKDTPKTSYSASVPMLRDSSMTSIAGDFNEDGHLDLVVGVAVDEDMDRRGKLYLFLGDGKGNFRQVEQTAEKPLEDR